jgi:hypothetical protein
MGRYKFSGVNGKSAAGKAPTRFEVYDGPTPPRAPYQIEVKKVEVSANKNGDPMLSTSVVVAEPAKKNGVTNPKARYNGAFAVDRQNITEESAGFVNAYLEALGCTKKDITAFWNSGVITEDTTRDGVERVTKIGTVKPDGVKAIAMLGLGQQRSSGGKTYEARLEVQSWLVASQLVGSQSDEDADSDIDEDEDLDDDAVEEDDDDAVEEDEESEEEDEEFQARQVELEGLSRVELKKQLKASGADLKVTSKTKDDEIVQAILDIEFPMDEDEEDEPEEDEPEEDEEEDDGDELDDLTRVKLKQINLSEGLGVKVTKSMTDDELREEMRAARLASSEEEPEEDEDEEEEPAKPAKAAPRSRRSKGAGEPPF